MRRVEAFDPIEAAIQRFIATALNEFRGELQVFRAEILAEIRRLDDAASPATWESSSDN